MNPDLAWAVWCGERQRRVEDVLARVLPAADWPPVPLSQAMRYAVLDGGKRMRPLLAYAAGELVAAMEGGQLPLKESLVAYKRGAELLQYCQSTLKDAEQQVQVYEKGLLKAFDAPAADVAGTDES